MIVPAISRTYICGRCLHARQPRYQNLACRSSHGPQRRYTDAATQRTADYGPNKDHASTGAVGKNDDGTQKEEGAMSRRLREMSEEALESGGRGARKAIEEAGFNAELKAQLEQRIATANLKSSEASIPPAASRHSRDLATAEVWQGTESIHDATLRMLNDARKPMRLGRPPKAPGVQMPKTIDTGHKRIKEQRGIRLANARDRSGIYANVKDNDALDAAERDKYLQELKERFEPGARAIAPGSISALTSLANQRIEDAIARGQFKNLPRGKGKNVERDYNASSPFIDTTEYFMNKIIQKQEIVPPWIEKQQELTAAVRKFRARLRVDWKRHAARIISSKGGTLQDQILRAEAYAKAELTANPIKSKHEAPASVDKQGQLSQITLSGELKVRPPPGASTGGVPSISEELIVHQVKLNDPSNTATEVPPVATVTTASTQINDVPLSTAASPISPAPFPFRDPEWERTESAYHALAIKDLNDKCRSYNLQAPELAKRPYFNLQRELNSCFADVAPQLAQEILDRTRRSTPRLEGFGQSMVEKSLFQNLAGGPVRIRDERTTKQYGFKQFWKDLWADKSKPT